MMMHNAHQYLTVCVPLFRNLFPLTASVLQSVVSKCVSSQLVDFCFSYWQLPGSKRSGSCAVYLKRLRHYSDTNTNKIPGENIVKYVKYIRGVATCWKLDCYTQPLSLAEASVCSHIFAEMKRYHRTAESGALIFLHLLEAERVINPTLTPFLLIQAAKVANMQRKSDISSSWKHGATLPDGHLLMRRTIKMISAALAETQNVRIAELVRSQKPPTRWCFLWCKKHPLKNVWL